MSEGRFLGIVGFVWGCGVWWRWRGEGVECEGGGGARVVWETRRVGRKNEGKRLGALSLIM